MLLPDGREFISWEQPLHFSKTYYVDNLNPRAADSNPGTQELPFLTINKAAQLLQPGEHVVIITGVYRERVDPARGGAGPDKMISYEAAPGANVVVKGSRVLKSGWERSTSFKLDLPEPARAAVKIYQRRVKGLNFEHAANAFPVPQRGMVSASRGSYRIIEDCTLRHANSVALDIGAQDWDMESPGVVGHSIVRRNHIDDVGICGIAGMAIQDSLLESNLTEHVGWQDVELTWETGGIKLHTTKNCLLRTNVIRHLVHSEAIWLDYLNSNTRVTANVMGDTLETLRGGIYLEASHDANMLDDNIIWKATEGKGGGSFNMPPHGGWGITVDGSDETVVAHNLIGYTQDAAIKFRTIDGRIVGTRGGTSRWNKVLNNIFYRCGKAIDFANRDNTAEGNLYLRDWGEAGDESQPVGRGLNWIPDAGAVTCVWTLTPGRSFSDSTERTAQLENPWYNSLNKDAVLVPQRPSVASRD